ncbi:MAG TPA: flagellar basal body rod protein FlgB [Dissulfurispiraceae bacterium]|nr:flagellar basal body rod protein FlgB [Dissulfurispiraceae bacterium]
MPDAALKTLETMLDVAASRHRILTSNIANADTPGYRARDISFQRELDKALTSPQGKGNVTVFESAESLPNRDGNSVNLDLEMAKIAENTLIYNTATQLMAMKIRMMKDAVK